MSPGIFSEIGPDVEATLVEIGEDGRIWISAGKVAGFFGELL